MKYRLDIGLDKINKMINIDDENDIVTPSLDILTIFNDGDILELGKDFYLKHLPSVISMRMHDGQPAGIQHHNVSYAILKC